MALQAVTLPIIERIFVVLDRLGISREAVVIPLAPGRPGGVRRLANGKLEITVDADRDLEAWLPDLERMLVEASASGS